jgi:hypothetical protein
MIQGNQDSVKKAMFEMILQTLKDSESEENTRLNSIESSQKRNSDTNQNLIPSRN